MPSVRAAAVVILLVVLVLVAGGCVQRNVERIGAEEAAKFAVPPEPQAPSAQADTPPIAATRISGVVDDSN